MISSFMVDNFFLVECLIEEGVSPTASWRGFIITTTRRQVVRTTTTTLGPSNRSDCLMRSQTRATGVAKIRAPCTGMLTVLGNLCRLKVKKLCAVLCRLNLYSFRFHYRMNLISEFIFYNSIFSQVKRLRQIVHLDNKRLHSPFIPFIDPSRLIVVKWQNRVHIYIKYFF